MRDADTSGGAMGFLKKILGWVDNVLCGIERAIIALVIVVIVGSMGLIAADALGRYLFNSPITFTVELVSHYLLPVMLLLPASMVLRRAGHISVDLFASLLPVRLFQALIGVAFTAIFPVFWLMTDRIAGYAIESFQMHKVSVGLIPWPLWVEQAIYAVILALLTLRLAHVALANLVAAVSGDAEIGISMLNPHDSPLEEAV